MTIQGINASKTNIHGLEAPIIFVPGIQQIIPRSGPQPPMSQISVVSIGSLLNRELGAWTNDWVHLNGLVVSYQPGQSIVIKDPTGVIRGRVVQLTDIHGDARVDLWGFLESQAMKHSSIMPTLSWFIPRKRSSPLRPAARCPTGAVSPPC